MRPPLHARIERGTHRDERQEQRTEHDHYALKCFRRWLIPDVGPEGKCTGERGCEEESSDVTTRVARAIGPGDGRSHEQRQRESGLAALGPLQPPRDDGSLDECSVSEELRDRSRKHEAQRVDNEEPTDATHGTPRVASQILGSAGDRGVMVRPAVVRDRHDWG